MSIQDTEDYLKSIEENLDKKPIDRDRIDYTILRIKTDADQVLEMINIIWPGEMEQEAIDAICNELRDVRNKLSGIIFSLSVSEE